MSGKISRIFSTLVNIGQNSKNFNSTTLLQRCNFHTTVNVDGKMKFINQGIDISKYTLKPLRCPKSGGRGYDGRIQVHGRGGGTKQHYRMVDYTRNAVKDGPSVVERVMSVLYDPKRSARIAVVATGEKKRYIIASENMKEGDIIKSSNTIPRLAVVPVEGNAHPIGAMPLGTLVHNIEEYVGKGGRIARAAGTSGQIVRKMGDRCIIKVPSGNEINLPKECIATVGRVSNINHNMKKFGSAGAARWAGFRPSSGLWQKKTGRHGRKIKKPRTTVKPDEPPKPKPRSKSFTF